MLLKETVSGSNFFKKRMTTQVWLCLKSSFCVCISVHQADSPPENEADFIAFKMTSNFIRNYSHKQG